MTSASERSEAAEEISDEPPPKIRRTARACLQCRARKQRCLPETEDSSPQAACHRCHRLEITCSFETELQAASENLAGPAKLAQIVIDLQKRVNLQEARVTYLEQKIAEGGACVENGLDGTGTDPVSWMGTQQPPESQQGYNLAVTTASSVDLTEMTTMELGPPIATLRRLGALPKDRVDTAPVQEVSPVGRHGRSTPFQHDPVSMGILTAHELQVAFDIFFTHCHPHAPLLSLSLRNSYERLRSQSPALHLSICAIGARFWPQSDPLQPSSTDRRGPHPKYAHLVTLLDQAVGRLLLRPQTSDASLDTIRVLLLYAQWMPFDSVRAAPQTAKTRYNDVSAWAVLGLANRYAVFIGLEHAAIAPFIGDAQLVTEEDMSRLRAWNNLVTCDCNLMLTSGLPASLNPTKTAQISRSFGTHRLAQQPSDLRVAALLELVVITNRAVQTSGDLSGRAMDTSCLMKANLDLDEWEKHWSPKLRETEAQHCSLPFTSVRWYRLALNSASLGPLLSVQPPGHTRPLQVSLLQSLEASINAAAQIIISLSSYGSSYVWTVSMDNEASWPLGPWSPDAEAVARLYFAVDSAWISHTFAVTFLVLCYIRGTVDDNLHICLLNPYDSAQTRAPSPPRPGSILTRLLDLAVAVFDSICGPSCSHPAKDFAAVVNNARSLVLSPSILEARTRQDAEAAALQTLYDLMNDSGLEWAGGLLGSGTTAGHAWESEGTSGLYML
ncbi:hypothetical protein BCR39DRAFT_584987 [Naematelia encephala]|uniref:Zn(2)-C6 fungal-type domain-containing protein n=1 Tax=Naematelia encephala TaxID=71784 RepID=A0A1Y2BKQ3_9TREE|nr:hypothetical protein BCR39DRAFT_584987 [Naematelia encephala]